MPAEEHEHMAGTFNVRNAEIETKLRQIGQRIENSLEGTPFGFALFLVEFNNADGGCFYISSAQRPDIVPVIEAWCARQRQ